jgi:hypothetical protein
VQLLSWDDLRGVVRVPNYLHRDARSRTLLQALLYLMCPSHHAVCCYLVQRKLRKVLETL